MSPAQQMKYIKTVKMSQWPTDQRTSKALILAVVASMVRPASASNVEAVGGALQAFFNWLTGREVARQVDKFSGFFPKAVVASIIIMAAAYLRILWMRAKTENKKTNIQAKQLNMLFEFLVNQEVQKALQNPPTGNARVVPANVPASAVRHALPAPNNQQLLAAMSLNPTRSHSRRPH